MACGTSSGPPPEETTSSGAIVKSCGRDLTQAASLTSIPSTNLAPETTAWRRGEPFEERQPFEALSIRLNTIARHAVRLPLPLDFTVRSRTVANVDSIGLAVRMCLQCSAGKSSHASNAPRSLSRHPVTLGDFAS